jgi:dihydropteroate synthase
VKRQKTNKSNILKWPTGKLDFSGGYLLMGVLNVTPDSFSDGGQFIDRDKAIEQGIKMAAEGAAIVDVGPESTRPGAQAVTADEQIHRAIPVIAKLAKKTVVCISIDTTNYEVARAALDAGANIINDITALADQRMAQLVAKRKVPVILMHMQGTPRTMQVEPKYKDVVSEVLKFLLDKAKRAEKSGIPKERIFIDPGIGFGKTVEHNLKLLANIDKFVKTDYRVLVGPSRKWFIGKLTGKEEPADRTFGTAAAVALCAASGVSIVRVHDVAKMIDVVKIVNAIIKEKV